MEAGRGDGHSPQACGSETFHVRLCGWIYTFLNLQKQDGFFKQSFPGVDSECKSPLLTVQLVSVPQKAALCPAGSRSPQGPHPQRRASRLRNLNGTSVYASFPVMFAPVRPGLCAALAYCRLRTQMSALRARLCLSPFCRWVLFCFFFFTPTLCLGDCPTPANTELACSF